MAQNWHSQDFMDILKSLESRPDGLTSGQVNHRLQQYGPNRLPSGKKVHPFIRFLKQFDNLLIYVLLASSVITALMQHWVDSGVIFGVVFINAIIGFVQEGKAEKALDAIRNMLTFQSSVLRDGRRISIPIEELVPGDIVLIESGDKIPADLRWISTRDLKIDESLLTGESVPVEKEIAPVPENTSLADRNCMGYAGTFATSGRGSGVVIATASATEVGRISEMVRDVQTLQTPLLRKIAQFGKQLTVVILGSTALVVLFGVAIRNYSFSEMFLAGVGLAVAAIPEGLPAIITITLAIGVNRMARRNAIIRRLPAVEALGSVTVICSDKTGTLTQNEMTVTQTILSDQQLVVTGTGYDPHGEIRQNGQSCQCDKSKQLLQLARASVLCNDASVNNRDGRWQISGDPMEAALIVLGHKCDFEPKLLNEEWPRLDVIPFESQHRFMATLNHDHEGNRIIYVKGAPETLLSKCTMQLGPAGPEQLTPDYWKQQLELIARNGQRSLAMAYKLAHSDKRELSFEDVQADLIFIGMCGIIDPPRSEAINSVNLCRKAGIKVKMITGDNSVTAQAIGAQMGIGIGHDALTGDTLSHADQDQMAVYARDVDVFGRVSPEHKLVLVQTLQAQNEIVVMTGDGVNDAPALKQADVGVAMGQKGTEAAKEAAEVVLADDNFASIVSAVEEGRTVYDNIQKAILFILPTNAAEAIVIVAAIFLGYTLPITPVQILWVNMITAVTLALSLAFEPPEIDIMSRPPRRPDEPIISGLLIWRLIFVSAILVAGTFGLFLWEMSRDSHIQASRTIAVNVLVMFEVFYLLNSRYMLRSVLSFEGLFGNRYVLLSIVIVLLLQLAFTYLRPMQLLFDTMSLGFSEWGHITVVGFSVLVLVEIEKAIIRYFQDHKTS